MIDEPTFIGEVLKGCRNLTDIRPLLTGSEEEQQKIIGEVQNYFEQESWKYLRHKFK